MRVVLASSSPRRKELMKMFNIPYEVIVKNVDETINYKDNIYDACMDVAKRKAFGVYNDIKDDVIVIGSDTIVFYNNKIYGKPKDYLDAKRMLNDFCGNKHEVISSLCVIIRKNNREYIELTYDKCDVYVSKMSNQEIDEWIENNDVYTRAGAYAIQDGFAKYIEKIEGDYFSIVGLPVHKLYEIMKKY